MTGVNKAPAAPGDPSRIDPRLIITIDTELSSFPDAQGLWGRVGTEEWGLARLLALLHELEVPATFFLDVYGGDVRDAGEQERAAVAICAGGHDLQLHTHPAPAFDRARGQMRQYSAAEQTEILEFGAQRLHRWSGTRPVAHRAGDWAANTDTLKALSRTGFRADFSACPWSASCELDAQMLSGNGWRSMHGILCALGTCYRDGLTGRIRRLDLGGSSFAEVSDIVSRAIDPLIVTLHSFSLLSYDRSRTMFAANTAYAGRLRRLCALARGHGYQIATAREAIALGPGPAPWQPLPRTRPASSFAGLIKSLGERLAAT